MTVFMLRTQAGWRCRHSGACCTAGWEIAADASVETAVRDGLASGRLHLNAAVAGRGSSLGTAELFRPRPGLPEGARSVLATDPHGRCVFFEPEGRLCALHGEIGPQALPSACRHFPRI